MEASGSIVLWGCFSSAGTLDFVRIQGMMDGTKIQGPTAKESNSVCKEKEKEAQKSAIRFENCSSLVLSKGFTAAAAYIC